MKTLQLASITKNTLLNKTLETAYLVSDYYKALYNNKRLPETPFPSLEEALRCNRIRDEYIKLKNHSIKSGLKLINSKLTTAQIVWTWQQIQAAKFNTGFNNSIHENGPYRS